MQNKKKMEAAKLLNAIYDQALHNDKSGTCSLTGVHYDNYGNNAYPFDGRCSDWENTHYVIPARLMGVTPEMIQRIGKKTVMDFIDTLHKEGKFNFHPVTVPMTISELMSLGVNM